MLQGEVVCSTDGRSGWL